jgi:hypothetical protein
MKLFKHAENSDLYQIHELTEDQLVGIFGMCVNYKGYASQLLSLPNKTLHKIAPGGDVALMRESIALQLKTSEEYIEFWKEATHMDKSKKAQN